MSAPARIRKDRAAREGDPAQFTPPSDTANSSLYRAEDGYLAPTADERREAALLAEVRTLGYGITVPCLMCRRPLTAPRSLVSHVGPVCAARMGLVIR